jgi:3-isopropylmalate/(R)-2-methylmalate dehydratase small subunit
VVNLIKLINDDPSTLVKVNVSERKIEIPSTGDTFFFEINSYKQECLINGLDDIDYLLSMKNRIIEFEKRKEM